MTQLSSSDLKKLFGNLGTPAVKLSKQELDNMARVTRKLLAEISKILSTRILIGNDIDRVKSALETAFLSEGFEAVYVAALNESEFPCRCADQAKDHDELLLGDAILGSTKRDAVNLGRRFMVKVFVNRKFGTITVYLCAVKQQKQ